MTPGPAHPLDDARISDDRECPNCGYNLKGLSRGGRCPECGRGIGGRVAGRYRDSLAYAPPAYLRTLRLGLGLMAASIPLLCIPVLPMLVWAAGAWIALTRRPVADGTLPDAILDSDRLRTLGRWLQLPPIAGVMLITLADTFPPTAAGGPSLIANLFYLAGGLLVIAGAVGYIPLSLYLSAIADWASHDSVANRLRGSAWFMAVLGTGVAVCFIVPVLRFFGVWLGVAWIVAVVFFLISVLQLAHAVHWAVKNQKFAEGSAARIAEKKAKRLGEPSKVHDLICRRCGYDLEGLPFGGHCPECGESYADFTPMPVREAPRRRPEDEAPIPLSGSDEDAPQQIRFSRGLGGEPDGAGDPPRAPRPAPSEPDPFAPRPFDADPDGGGEIPLAPDDPRRP